MYHNRSQNAQQLSNGDGNLARATTETGHEAGSLHGEGRIFSVLRGHRIRPVLFLTLRNVGTVRRLSHCAAELRSKKG